MYVARTEGFYSKVDGLFEYLVVTCNDETFIATAEHLIHIKGLQATVSFSLKVGGVNVITYTLKSRNYVAASNVPVIVVPRALVQEPVCFVHRKILILKLHWSLTTPLSFASFASSWFFFTYHLSFLTYQR